MNQVKRSYKKTKCNLSTNMDNQIQMIISVLFVINLMFIGDVYRRYDIRLRHFKCVCCPAGGAH